MGSMELELGLADRGKVDIAARMFGSKKLSHNAWYDDGLCLLIVRSGA